MEVRLRNENTISLSELIALFEPIQLYETNPATSLPSHVWGLLLEDYASGKLAERIETLTPAQKMTLMNIACKIQSIVVASTT
jgi:hypothetical protein